MASGPSLRPPPRSFVSRMENLGIPLFAGVIRASNAILVDRSGQPHRRHRGALLLLCISTFSTNDQHIISMKMCLACSL